MARRTSYNVAPRYSAGSPAAVDEKTMKRVAEQERDGYARTLTGVYGEEEKQRAEMAGLEGIAYVNFESGGAMVVQDAITGAEFKVPLKYWGHIPSGGSVSWYSRKDRAQFKLGEGMGQFTTDFEKRGKRYEAIIPCMWCGGRPEYVTACKRCLGAGTEKQLLKKGA